MSHSGLTGETVARLDLRLVPIALPAWAAAWLGTGGTVAGLAVVGLLTVMVLAAAVRRRSVPAVAVALVLVVLAGMGAVRAYQLRSGPLAQLARDEAVVGAVLVIRADPQRHPAEGVRSAYATAQATVLQITGRGESWRLRAPALLVASGAGADQLTGLVVGSQIDLSARLQPPDPGAEIAAVVRLRGGLRPSRDPGPGAAAVERVRTGLREAVADRPAEPRALVPALVLGDTSRLTPELTEDFQSTGLTHLTAVSGANLTLLLAFVLTMARWAGVRGWWLRLAGLLGVAVFVALCRTEPSVLRAAAMGLVALAALGAGGRRAGIRNLGVAMVVLLLLDPFLSRSVGFALSVLASGGIIWWASRWADVLGRWLPRVLAELISVPLAAHLATLPLVAAIAGQVSVSGLVANAVAGPLVGPATVLGFVTAGLSLLSAPAAAVAGFGAAWCTQGIIWVAHAGAALPGSEWRWPTTWAALTWLTVAAALVGLSMTWVLGRRWLTLVLTAVMVVALAAAPTQPGWPPRDWVMVSCDVGQGDGLVLRVAARQAVVVDTGPEPRVMERCLDQLGIAGVPLLVLTHFHADHVDGLRGVWAGRRVGQVWVGPLAAPAYEAVAVVGLAAEHQTPVSTPAPGQQAQVGDVHLRVIGPVRLRPAGTADSSVENDSSLVLMATSGGVRLLLTGDVEPSGQRAIMAGGVDLRAQVLKIPHHGSARQDPGFFAATGASIAIASAGVDNDYGHPAPRTVQLARSLGMTVLQTNVHGGVAVTRRGDQIGVVTQR